MEIVVKPIVTYFIKTDDNKEIKFSDVIETLEKIEFGLISLWDEDIIAFLLKEEAIEHYPIAGQSVYRAGQNLEELFEKLWGMKYSEEWSY